MTSPAADGTEVDDSGELAFHFGQCRVLPRARRLVVKGKTVEIGGRAFDTLLALIEAKGMLLSKEELQQRVWPDTHVEASNIRVQISMVRKALGPDRDVITTVPGRGFMLAANVRNVGPEPVAKPVPDERVEPNLPKYLSALIGRGDELAKLRDNLALGRLVTVVGTGGIGKTRLAVDIGSQLAGGFADGVRYVDLAPASDPAAVVSVTAVALGIAIKAADVGAETIATVLGKRKQLLIFDNCEHVVADAAALIQTILTRAVEVTVLATSQEALNLEGERIFRLGSLALPPEGAADVSGYAAVALFLHRAAAVDCRLDLEAGHGAVVADICRRLDGIPLVLEMAAARLPLLGLGGLHAAIDKRFKLLTVGARWAGNRHSTLLAMVEWSHSLLGPAEQALFHRLSVFPGSFSLEAAIAVAGAAGEESWQTVEGLDRLLAKSFLRSESPGHQRFRLLESHRLYALERFSAEGGLAAAAERHARYFADLMGTGFDAIETTPDARWLETYQPEIDNLRAALTWAFSPTGSAALAIELAGNGGRLWQMLGLVGEGRQHVDRALAMLTEAAAPAAAARLLLQAAALHRMDHIRSIAYAERAAELYRQTGDVLGLAVVQSHTGIISLFCGRFAEAESLLSAAGPVLEQSDRKRSLCNVLMNRGTLAALTNHLGEALAAYAHALDLARALKLTQIELDLLHNCGEVEFYTGAVDRAIEITSALAARLDRGNNTYVPAHTNLAWFLLAKDRVAEAREIAARPLGGLMEIGGQALHVAVLQWGLIAALDGLDQDAARLLGFVEAAFSRTSNLWQPIEDQGRARLSALLTERLPPGDLAAARAAGAALSEGEAVAYAGMLAGA